MRALLGALVAAALLWSGAPSCAEEPLPPAPAAYFNDYAGVVSAGDAARLDAKLGQFAKETSTQVVVAIFDHLPSPSLEDFTVRTAESWRVGRKDWDNGAVLFVFVKDRKLRIETGYGLEGALPDALARRILDDQVVPRLRQGDWPGGLEAGIDGILAATRGEYKAEAQPRKQVGVPLLTLVIVLFLVVLLIWLASQGARHLPSGRTYSRRGPRRDSSCWGGSSWGGWGGGGGFGGGGGSFGGGGGGFSGGGGSFGGGGASSSW
ncbi:MAG: TPM domain-containing protein [Burkholderiales bacterium]